MSGSDWHPVYAAKAREYWSAERVAELTGGKQLRLTPDRAPCLLRAMGVLDGRGRMQPSRVRKYRQINHLLSFLEPALGELAAGSGSIGLIDAGCGRSALGFLVAWWLGQRGVPAQILGIDHNPDVLRGCRERAVQGGLAGMVFAEAELGRADIPSLWRDACGTEPQVDAVLALHACDTATDVALQMAVELGARFFAVAPCCQAELARAWSTLEPGPLGPIHSNPHLRRTAAATVTDAMRAELMGAAGYQVRVVEFVEAHHTPKNTLIYGHLGAEKGDRSGYDALVRSTGGCGIGLAEKLTPHPR